jgi:hypothetical protein
MIKLTITTKNGTTVSLDIPDTEDATVANSRVEQASAVVYPVEHDKRVEASIPYQSEDLAPTGKTYKSVEDMLLDQGLSEIAESVKALEKMEEGEVGGEEGGCKGEEGELGGEEEEKPEQNVISLPARNGGTYHPSPALLRDLIAIYGKSKLDSELLLARAWLNANPNRQKSMRGTGRFIAAWMQRASRQKPGVSGSLIVANNGTENQEGW